MVKVKIPEKFCLFTFCPLCPLLRCLSFASLVFLYLYLFLSLSLAVLRCVPTSRFFILSVCLRDVFWKHGIKWYLCHITIVLHDRTFISFLPFLVFPSFFFINHSYQRLDVSSTLFSTSDDHSSVFSLTFSYLIPLSSFFLFLSWLLMRNLRRIERTRRISLHYEITQYEITHSRFFGITCEEGRIGARGSLLFSSPPETSWLMSTTINGSPFRDTRSRYYLSLVYYYSTSLNCVYKRTVPNLCFLLLSSFFFF